MASFLVVACGAWASACGVGDCRADEGVVVGEPGPALTTARPLRVLTLNLLHGFGDDTNERTLEQRLARVLEDVSSQLPDVLLLQEASVTPATAHCNVVERLRSALTERTDVPWQSVQIARNGGDVVSFFEGPALLSWHPLLDAAAVEYAAQAPFEHRSYVRAATSIVDASGDSAVQLTWFSTHLTNLEDEVDGEPARVRQARELATAASAGASVVGGDLNAPADSPVLEALTNAGGVDLWPAVATTDGGTSLDRPIDDESGDLVGRIDYVIAFPTPEAALAPESCSRVLDTPVDGLWASDHAGVVCDILAQDP